MYRRTTGRITTVTKDLSRIEIKIPISYKNKNYVGTIFGGSLFAATDPIYMVQLIQLLGTEYVVWDKSSVVKFRRPANTDAYAVFEFTESEIAQIKSDIRGKKEIDLIKPVEIKSKYGKVFCEIEKRIYVADKKFYKEKKAKKATP
jgi:acyl-coenzyme A thioesterase PaaI-like protein